MLALGLVWGSKDASRVSDSPETGRVFKFQGDCRKMGTVLRKPVATDPAPA